MKYLIEIDSLQNLSCFIENYLEFMIDAKYLEGEIDHLPKIKVELVEED